MLLGALLSFGLLASPPALAEDEKITKSWAIAEFGEPLYKDGFDHWPYANPDAPKGGEVVLGAFGSFDSFNTFILKGDWPRSIGLIGDTLMVSSGDELSAAYGLIAETVELPADKSWMIFNLRPEAQYQDGHPITASDFVFSFDTIREHGRPFLKSFYDEFASVEALDDHRLKVSFTTVDSMKPVMIAAGLSPLPQHWWESEGRDITKTTLEPPLGSGAYRITRVDPGRSITYELVEDYWAKNLPVNKGLNNYGRIRYDYYLDASVMFEAFKAGKIDYRQENRSQRWATGYDIKPVEDGRMIKRVLPDERPRGIQAYFFNLRRDKFSDPRVREAISLLYDFETLKRTILYGFYTRTKSYFPNSDFGASGPPTEEEAVILAPFEEQLPSQTLTEAFEPPASDGTGRIRSERRKALALFKEAGWEVRDGILVNAASGEQLKIEILAASPGIERVTAIFLQNMRNLGIDATFRFVDTSQYQVRLDDFDFDMASVALNFFPPPGAEQRSYWGSGAADIRGSANMAGIKNEVVDALIEQVIEAKSLEQLKATNRALDRVLLWNFYTVPMYYNDETWIAYWDKFGYPDQKPRYDVGFLNTWWVDEQLATKLKN